MKKLFILSTSLLFSLLLINSTHAASLYFLSDDVNFGIGAEFNVSVKVDSGEDSMNATQATITFPNDILELVSIDRQNSVFNFWVEEPTINNEEGTMSFIGGTPKGISGSSLEVLKMKFRTTGAGVAELSMTDAIVTANDGKGTNILSDIQGLAIGVDTRVARPVLPSVPDVPDEQPVEIIRDAVAASSRPSAPDLRVPLYPDQTAWYNHIGDTTVFWDVTEDITQVATGIDRLSNTEPKYVEETLTNGRNFGLLTSGTWYAHIQFRNNRGWGEVAHYKISIDTNAPLPFEASISAEESNNPTPTVRFKTFDNLSGIGEAVLFIDGEEILRTKESVIKLPPQGPGDHVLIIRVYDNASNSIEDSLNFSIIPLATPTIDFITKNIAQNEPIFMAGTTFPDATVNVRLSNSINQEVYKAEIKSDEVGNWTANIGQEFPLGEYFVEVSVTNKEGASSYPTDPVFLRIQPKAILSIGFISMGWFEVIMMLALILVTVISFTSWYYVDKKKTREAYRTILGRDINNFSNMSIKELDHLMEAIERMELAPSEKAKISTHLNSLKKIEERTRKYLTHEADKVE